MTISVTNIGTLAQQAAGAASLSVTGVAVPTGSLILLGAAEDSTTVAGGSCADTHNTPYTAITAPISNNNLATNGFLQVFYFANATALLSTDSITYTLQVSGVGCAISAYYATGIATVSPLDTAVTATGVGAGAAGSVTSGTPVVAGELFISALSKFKGDDGISSLNGSWVAPFTSVGTGSNIAGSAATVGGGNQVNAGLSPITWAPTLTGPAQGANALLVAGFMPLVVITLIPVTPPDQLFTRTNIMY